MLQLTNGGIESSDFNDLPLCDVLGFAKGEDGKYYDNGKEVTGIMAVLADTPIKDIQSRVDTSETGELMGYDKAILPVLNENGDQVLDEQGNAVTKTVWYDGVDEAGNPKEIHPIMNRVASSKFDELDKLPDILVLGDVIPEDKRSGLVSFIDPETKIDDIPAAVDTVFNTTPLSDLVDEGVVVFDPLLDGDGNVIKTSEQRAEEFKQKAVSSWTMPQVMEFLFTADPQTPPTP